MTTRVGPRLPFPSSGMAGGGGRDLRTLIAVSGKLGPPRLGAGLELDNDRGHVRALVGVGHPEPFAERTEPLADLFQGVDRGHVQLKRWQRGHALPQDRGPLPGLCPPADQLNSAAPRSHTGVKDSPGIAKLGAKITWSKLARRCTLSGGGYGLARRVARLERASGRGSDHFRAARGGGVDLDLRGI